MNRRKYVNMIAVDFQKNLVNPRITNILFKRNKVAEIEAAIRGKEIIFKVSRLTNGITKPGWEKVYEIPFLTFFDALAEVCFSLKQFAIVDKEAA